MCLIYKFVWCASYSSGYIGIQYNYTANTRNVKNGGRIFSNHMKNKVIDSKRKNNYQNIHINCIVYVHVNIDLI